MTLPTLEPLLNPRAVAIVGASDNPHKVGGRPLLYLSKFGYRGRVYPINPLRDRVQGFKSYPDLASLPEAPDLAIIATPGDRVAAAVGECADRGVGATIVMSSGYAETADPAARLAQDALVARARAAGMRIVGPNSQGLANFGTGTVASFSTMFLETAPMDGPIGIISQSGIMSVLPYGLLRGMGLGVRHSHATGNEADITLADLAGAVLGDPEVRLLLLYIESIRDANQLAKAAALARERDVPIVAVKSGRTAVGQAAARSHTGALANEDRTVDAFFKRHGIWRVNDIHEMVSAAPLYLKGWRPKNRGMIVVSNSGASCVMAADSSQALEVQIATLPEATVTALAAELPSFATAVNPIDITAALLTDHQLLGRILRVVAGGSDAALCLIAIPVAGTGYDLELFAKDTAAFMVQTATCVAVAAPQETVASHFRDAGVPVFANQSEAMAALAQLAGHAALMRQPLPPLSKVSPLTLPPGQSQFLDEAESLDLLRRGGLPVVECRRCRSVAEAVAAFESFARPVVIKACSSQVPHKSEHGLVRLSVCDADGVARSVTELKEKMTALGVAGDILVAPMRSGRLEVLLGGKVDPLFGPVLMIGDGGKYVEVFGDVQVLLAPATAAEIDQAIGRLRIAPLFDGVRGEPALDREALCQAALSLGELIVAGQGQLASVDVNPVMVGARGDGVVVVDALVERAQPA